MRLLLLLAVALFSAAAIQAQRTEFDAVSVKPCKDGALATRIISEGGHLLLTCFPVAQMISYAYGETVDGRWNYFPLNSIEGGPTWIQFTVPSTNTYTIEARGPASAEKAELLGPMLRSLLEERFQLKVRRETRQMPAYALTVNNGGLKLKPFDGTCTVWDVPKPDAPSNAKPLCPAIDFGGQGYQRKVDFRGITMTTFAFRLGRNAQAGGDLDGTITDHTGLNGFFDIHLEYSGENPVADAVEIRPRLADALREQLGLNLREQLGLKLERTLGPRTFLVIEHIERPSEN